MIEADGDLAEMHGFAASRVCLSWLISRYRAAVGCDQRYAWPSGTELSTGSG
jgi:hypothetical protein